jgi:hypothetical protein
VDNVEVAYKLFYPTQSQPDEGFMEMLYGDWRKWAILFGIPASMVPKDRPAFHLYMAAELAELQKNLHPMSLEVVEKMQELSSISSALTKLPLLALPLAPLLLVYSGFNMAAVDATLPSLSRSYGREPEQPGMLLSATKTIWSNLPSSIRYTLLDSQQRLMLPLSEKFREKIDGSSGASMPKSRL